MTVNSSQVDSPFRTDEYLYFIARAFNGMLAALDRLGDDRINTTPPLPGANSPYAIVHHCVEVAEHWIGHLIAGRPTERDRDAEFHATGSLDALRARVAEVQRRIRADLVGVDLSTGPVNPPSPHHQGPQRPLSSVGVLLHVLEELAQHHGQLEISRDLLETGVAP